MPSTTRAYWRSRRHAIELKLTEEQKKQIVPMLQQAIKQPGEVKKDTKLSGAQKVEALHKQGVAFEEQVSPLLNPDQRQRFEELRATAPAHDRGGSRTGAGEGESGSGDLVRRRAQVALM